MKALVFWCLIVGHTSKVVVREMCRIVRVLCMLSVHHALHLRDANMDSHCLCVCMNECVNSDRILK